MFEFSSRSKVSTKKYTYFGRSCELDTSSHVLTLATRGLFGELDRSARVVAPLQFWMVMRKYP